MQNIQVNPNSLPDFALGGMFAGMNAADTQAANEQELGKMFLANQREQQMQPLDVQLKQLAIAPAEYEQSVARAKQSDPDYINKLLEGYKAQMQSQITAADSGKVLAPFKTAAEQAALENEKTQQGFQWTINDIDKKLQAGGGEDENGNVVPFTPGQIGFMKQKRDELVKQMASTPSFFQKTTLQDDKQENALLLKQMDLERKAAELEARVKAQQKQENLDKLAARMVSILSSPNSTPEQKAEASAALQTIKIQKLSENPMAYMPAADMEDITKGKIPTTTPLEKAQGGKTVRITSQEEWQKLPPGTQYILPDGRTGIR